MLGQTRLHKYSPRDPSPPSRSPGRYTTVNVFANASTNRSRALFPAGTRLKHVIRVSCPSACTPSTRNDQRVCKEGEVWTKGGSMYSRKACISEGWRGWAELQEEMSNSPFKNVNNLLVSHEDASYLPLLLQIRVVHNALTSFMKLWIVASFWVLHLTSSPLIKT